MEKLENFYIVDGDITQMSINCEMTVKVVLKQNNMVVFFKRNIRQMRIGNPSSADLNPT